MRHIPSIQPKYESFRSGYAKTAINKMASILQKRLRTKYVDVSDLSFEANNYSIYRVALGPTWTVDIKFQLGKSDTITQIDVYTRLEPKPDYSINVENLNIVQIINMIADLLIGDFDFSDLRESLSYSRKYIEGRQAVAGDMVQRWVNEDRNNIDYIRDLRLSQVYRDYFEPWMSSQGISLSGVAFSGAVRDLLKSKGMKNIFWRKDVVVPGERVVLTKTTEPKQETDFNSLMANLNYEERYEMVQEYIHQIARNLLNSLYIYGPPGTGKSHTVYAALKAEGVAYKQFSGAVKGVEELVRILYTYRDNTILVFDDFDSAMKSMETRNMMKAALQDDPVRTITYVNNKPRSKKLEIPPQFEFTSSVIVITNETKIDPAIRSRSMTVNIILTKDQMLDRIRKFMKDFLPEVDMDTKLEVFEFLQENKNKIKHIDFRQFKFAIVNRLARPTDNTWMRWVLVSLNA